MLNGYWQVIWEILMPVMPLIEVFASKLTDLGKIFRNPYIVPNITCLEIICY